MNLTWSDLVFDLVIGWSQDGRKERPKRAPGEVLGRLGAILGGLGPLLGAFGPCLGGLGARFGVVLGFDALI